MSIGFLKGLFFCILLLLAQVLVLNHIHLFNYATPLLYIYMVLRFRRNQLRWAVLLSCFVMGIAADTFSNTPGLTTITLTLMGFLHPYLLMPFLNREYADDIVPSARTLGFARFTSYALINIFLYCLVFFSVEAFNFFNWQHWLWCIIGSFLLTSLFVLVIEYARKS